MKKYTFLFVLCFSSIILAQLVQTNGPEGAQVDLLIPGNDELYIKTARGNMFHHNNENWERLQGVLYYDNITLFKGKLYTGNYQGLYDLGDGNEEPAIRLEGSSAATFADEEKLYAAVNDTIFSSVDGSVWKFSGISLKTNFDTTGTIEDEAIEFIETFAVFDSTVIVSGFSNNYMLLNSLFVSHDLGQTWLLPEDMGMNRRVSQIVKSGSNLYVNSNTEIFRSADNGLTWESFMTGLPEGYYSVKLAETDGGLFLSADYPGQLYRLSGDSWVKDQSGETAYTYEGYGEYLYIYGPEGIRRYNPSIDEVVDLNGGLIATSYTPLPVNENRAFAYNGSDSWFTDDGGQTWEKYPDMKFVTMTEHKNILAASVTGNIYVSQDEGATWTSAAGNLDQDRLATVTGITSDGEALYAGFAKVRRRDHMSGVWEYGGVFKSTDNGATWTQASSGLPVQAGVRVPISRLYPGEGQVIARTLEGLYRTTDGGSNWAFFEAGFPEYTYSFKYFPYNGKIYTVANTGIYYSDINSNEWMELNTGLEIDSTYYYVSAAFAEFEGSLYLVNGGAEPEVFRLSGEEWIKKEIELPVGVSFYNFASVNGILYAGTIEAGIWKGTLENTTGLYEETAPVRYSLSQNYPNPFNPTTNISYALPEAGHVSIVVYDALGREAATLVNVFQEAGEHKAEFNASGLASGVYFYRIKTAGFNEVKKMLLLK